MLEMELIEPETFEMELVGQIPSTTGGTTNYNDLSEKPKINDVELKGNKTLDELGIQPKGKYLTEEKDPTIAQHIKKITEEDIKKWNNKSDFSGNYNDLKDVPNLSQYATIEEVNSLIGTINGELASLTEVVE